MDILAIPMGVMVLQLWLSGPVDTLDINVTSFPALYPVQAGHQM